MSKRIFFDGLNLSLTRGTGIATYTRVLVGISRDLGYKSGILYSFQSKLPRDELAREIAFFDANAGPAASPVLRALGTARSYVSMFSGVRAQNVPLTGTVITEPLTPRWVPCDEIYTVPRVFDRARAFFFLTGKFLPVKLPAGVDLFHWTYPLPITSNARANIYTVHDLIPLRLPYASLDWKGFHLRMIRAMLARADHIVTVSENSKRDLMKYFAIEDKRITNTFAAAHIPECYLERTQDEIATELAGVFGLELRGYFLSYGSLEPKKNVGRIIQAYAAAKVDIPLVVVVAQSWLAEEDTRLLDLVMANRAGGGPTSRKRIIRYEYMPARHLITLIQGARAVLFPSLYEGFGLPILEAMALGTPVITSTTSSTPEVAGDAALLVNPHDVDQIKRAVEALHNDDDLCAALRTKGLNRVTLFSLDAYRERVSKVYAAFT